MTQTAEIASPPAKENGSARRSYVPNVDIVERNGDTEVYVDLPGAKPESVRVNFEEGLLTIDADVAERQPAGTTYLLREYGVGDFHRSFRVADTVDSAKIEANYRDGVLMLKLPKVEQARPRKIEVRSN